MTMNFNWLSLIRRTFPKAFSALNTRMESKFFQHSYCMYFNTDCGAQWVVISDHSCTGDEYESFYRCSTKRWLYNEQQQLAQRYLRFNVPALKKVAAKAVGARTCVSMVKTAEGSYNKVFSLRFENGAEVIARIPCPIAGPAHLVVASEVATLDFVRTHMQIPVPKVLAWSSSSSKNEVGAEYIIMEKLNGVPLSDRWPDIKGAEAMRTILKIISYEKRFSDFRFSQIGNLYFKEDVAPELQACRLYADGVPDDKASEKYRIGPTLQREFWRGERIHMEIDRGPWPDTQSYALAIINCEKLWLRTHAHRREKSDPFLISEGEGDPEKHLEMLDRFESIIPLIICGRDIFQPTLWHSDLHDSNIMVDPVVSEVTGIIDWQESIGPKFLKAGFPRFLRYDGDLINIRADKPSLPEGFEEFSKEKQDEARLHLRFASKHRVYEFTMRKEDPAHYEVLYDPRYYTLFCLFRSASRTWTDGLVPLRQALLEVAALWYINMVGPDVHCPIGEIREDEFQHHVRLYERTLHYDQRVKILHETLGLEPDGVVDPEKYDAVKVAADLERALWDDERDGGPWPLQDGGWSSLL